MASSSSEVAEDQASEAQGSPSSVVRLITPVKYRVDQVNVVHTAQQKRCSSQPILLSRNKDRERHAEQRSPKSSGTAEGLGMVTPRTQPRSGLQGKASPMHSSWEVDQWKKSMFSKL